MRILRSLVGQGVALDEARHVCFPGALPVLGERSADVETAPVPGDFPVDAPGDVVDQRPRQAGRGLNNQCNGHIQGGIK